MKQEEKIKIKKWQSPMKSPMERKDPALDSGQYAQESGRQERTVSETKARQNLRKQLW